MLSELTVLRLDMSSVIPTFKESDGIIVLVVVFISSDKIRHFN